MDPRREARIRRAASRGDPSSEVALWRASPHQAARDCASRLLGAVKDRPCESVWSTGAPDARGLMTTRVAAHAPGLDGESVMDEPRSKTRFIVCHRYVSVVGFLWEFDYALNAPPAVVEWGDRPLATSTESYVLGDGWSDAEFLGKGADAALAAWRASERAAGALDVRDEIRRACMGHDPDEVIRSLIHANAKGGAMRDFASRYADLDPGEAAAWVAWIRARWPGSAAAS